jgi:hypothetical protein
MTLGECGEMVEQKVADLLFVISDRLNVDKTSSQFEDVHFPKAGSGTRNEGAGVKLLAASSR